jgi:hypothetical protein
LNPDEGIFPFVSNLIDTPISLVHSRFDMDCRPEQAFHLKSLLPHLHLKIVAGNHDLEEEPMATAYKEILSEMLMLPRKELINSAKSSSVPLTSKLG